MPAAVGSRGAGAHAWPDRLLAAFLASSSASSTGSSRIAFLASSSASSTGSSRIAYASQTCGASHEHLPPLTVAKNGLAGSCKPEVGGMFERNKCISF